eukprot:CAMPEP_0168477288 /NCGR_PEP_ID=MMETSP0228-20121227/62331_1 /TAXON_ID=133427 /ORGANISM="Protoceratium reticulatum, Strain CCCM 535 (=CCMP 1889)" /LENGTH=61 /DNA_ID=CAMNT_0008493445 /DNA_START=47 /DNA_END=230 /DNA_ORIENTATION=-
MPRATTDDSEGPVHEAQEARPENTIVPSQAAARRSVVAFAGGTSRLKKESEVEAAGRAPPE